ncbi:unnamed protein product [Symbiodinium sp. CCMP2592]|nr:unnamed protein product [Symbiodinium sp. CCMP2592]
MRRPASRYFGGKLFDAPSATAQFTHSQNPPTSAVLLALLRGAKRPPRAREVAQSQEERGELHNRLAVACRQASSKELPKAQASQRESAELVAKAGHQNRCEQRSNGNLPKQGQMQVCSERKGIQKQRIREPE